MQKGDVPTTFSDVIKVMYLLGYIPSTSIEKGISKFVKWLYAHNASQYRMSPQ
jgi:hypothetical protein